MNYEGVLMFVSEVEECHCHLYSFEKRIAQGNFEIENVYTYYRWHLSTQTRCHFVLSSVMGQ